MISQQLMPILILLNMYSHQELGSQYMLKSLLLLHFQKQYHVPAQAL